DRRERVALNVPDNTNNHSPIALELIRTAGRVCDVEPLADGVAVWPELACEEIVDDNYVLVCCIVSFREVASVEQCRADGAEISRQNGTMICITGVPEFCWRAFLPVVVVPVRTLLERNVRHRRHGFHSGKRLEILLQLPQHLVSRRRQLKGENIF